MAAYLSLIINTSGLGFTNRALLRDYVTEPTYSICLSTARCCIRTQKKLQRTIMQLISITFLQWEFAFLTSFLWTWE